MSENDLKKSSGFIGWIDARLPIFSYIKSNLVDYKTPKNLNYLWNLGVLSGVSLVLQILTGIILAMHYNPSDIGAFDSVEHIMRDVNYGWLIRYIHAVGASTFFICVYIHIFRGFYYGSYKSPRELLWIIGVIIFLLMMATAFMGYVLPWGQMSFWAATVITNIFSAIPFVGNDIVTWLLGGYAVGNPTLNRFFALHYLLPFIIIAVVFLHLWALHQFGSNNPTGLDCKSEKDKVPFHPFYTVKDAVTLVILFMIISFFVFFAPNYLGHPDNYIEADPMVTPMHIVPEWYFLPFYAMLRAIPSKIGGVVVLFGSILIWLFLPWLDSSKIRSGRFRPVFKVFYLLFLCDFLFLMYLGSRGAVEPYVTLSMIATFYYFFHFLVILPLLGKYEKGNLPQNVDSK